MPVLQDVVVIFFISIVVLTPNDNFWIVPLLYSVSDTSLPIMWNTCTFSCEDSDVLLDFNQIWILSTCLRHESPQYENYPESRADTRGQTDKHGEAICDFGDLSKHT